MRDLRVLIVEDDPRVAELHRRFTGRVDGFAVVGVAAGLPEAADMAELLGPDLVLLDLHLPDGSGLDLLHELRRRGQDVDVILVTAARDAATVLDARRGGAFDYIIKPVEFARFAAALTRFREHRAVLAGGGELDQAAADRLLGAAAAPAAADDLPKGIDPLTLGKVRAVFGEPHPDGLSAEAVGESIGTSRSTARRYLEYLVARGDLDADLLYGSVGRPERRYRRR